jgi:hypothetical protein
MYSRIFCIVALIGAMCFVALAAAESFARRYLTLSPGPKLPATLSTGMRIVLGALALVISSPALANGPEEWELLGISSSGKKVYLTYGGSQLAQANKGMPVYRDLSRPEYGYCLPSASATVGEYFLHCSQRLGGKPDLIFKKDSNEETTAYYRKAKAIYQKHFKDTEFRSCGGYYRCINGCSRDVAELLAEIDYGD